jgi:hypothetical protein
MDQTEKEWGENLELNQAKTIDGNGMKIKTGVHERNQKQEEEVEQQY